MKKQILTTIAAIFLTAIVFAQAPSKMSYQSVIRNAANGLVSNQQVGIRVQIVQGSEFGSAKYVETHAVTTNVNGLVTLEIGTGTIVTGNFLNIDWADGPYFIKTETDPAGGSSYNLTTLSEIMSVPFAILATKAKTADSLLNGFSLDQAYRSGGAGTGRKISADEGAVLIDGRDGLEVSGKVDEGAEILNYDPSSNGVAKMFFNPKKAAFRVGYVDNENWDMDSIGKYSFAAGRSVKAVGTSSTAMGVNAIATGSGSVSIGNNTTATGINSTAIGFNTHAVGLYSAAFGGMSTAKGRGSTAMGLRSEASGDNSFALGEDAKAFGENSFAIGYMSAASKIGSIAFGSEAISSGKNSVALGSNYASGEASLATGSSTQAVGISSFTGGTRTTARGENSIAMGFLSEAKASNSIAIGERLLSSGNNSTAFGYYTSASGNHSTAIGSYIVVSGEGSMYLADHNRTEVNRDLRSSDNTFYGRFDNGYFLYTQGAANTNIGARLEGGANSWSVISDSAKKENFTPVNGKNFLDKIASMNLASWNYKGQDPKNYRHYGPTAQDFYNAFGKDELGTIGNDSTIASADFAGVSFIAIQALAKENKELKEELSGVNNEMAKMRSQDQNNSLTIAALEKKLRSLDQQNGETMKILQTQLELLSTDLKEYKKYASMQKELEPVVKK